MLGIQSIIHHESQTAAMQFYGCFVLDTDGLTQKLFQIRFYFAIVVGVRQEKNFVFAIFHKA